METSDAQTQTGPPAALLTGASGGIGRAMATVLGEEGFTLTLVARTADKLNSFADTMRSRGCDVHAVATDISSEDNVRAVVESHITHHGRLDVLINNAGFGITSTVDAASTRQIDLQLSVNLRAAILLTRDALPHLKTAGAEHGRAWLVNTSSMAGKSAIPELAIYSAAKHGLVGFTDSVNRELGGSGVRACVLCPGYVDTPLADFVRESIPAEKMIRPEDLGESLRYLLRLSDSCLVPEISLVRPGLVT